MVKAKFTVDMGVFIRKMEQGMAKQVIPFASDMLAQLGEKAHANIVKLTPRTRQGRTDIKALWKMEHTRRGTVESYVIENTYRDQNVILWMEEGTRAHIIRPKKPGGSLRWINEASGAAIYAKVVFHPGTRAYHMLDRTQPYVQGKLNEYIEATLKMGKKIAEGSF